MTKAAQNLMAVTEPAPLVSVIIPAFNRKDDLAETLASVLMQDFTDFEIIVVDDGSSDGTDHVNFAAVDDRIRLARHLVNRGGSAARNTGIDNARGKLVAFLDSDDQWVPHKLRTQLDSLSAEGCISGWSGGEKAEIAILTDFFAASNVTIDTAGVQRPHNLRGPAADEQLADYLMVEGQALQTSTLILPTALARKVRFRDGLRRHQDWDFAIRLDWAGARLVYLDQQLATYCLNDDPRRITRQKGRLRATLDWYRICGGRLSSRAMQIYFIRSILSRDFKREPVTGLLGLWWLTTRSREDFELLVRRLLTEICHKFQRWWGKGKSSSRERTGMTREQAS